MIEAASTPRRLRTAPVLLFCFLGLLCGLIHPGSAAAEEAWTFSVISDAHARFSSFQNVLKEMKDPTADRDKRPGMPEFVLGLGDFSPVSENHALFRNSFPKVSPVFFPTRGNHETARDLSFIRSVILPEVSLSGHRLNLFGGSGLSYWVDWRNIRLIVLDQYADFPKNRPAPIALKWLGTALETAGDKEHIFLAFHEPRFPWRPNQDPLWQTFLKYQSRVTAIFFGHTHFYDHTRYPGFRDGIHLINAGNAGESRHSDGRQTLVNVIVRGRLAWVRTLQTPDTKARFSLWEAFALNR